MPAPRSQLVFSTTSVIPFTLFVVSTCEKEVFAHTPSHPQLCIFVYIMLTTVTHDMRLSIACATTDAEFQNPRIILHDNTLNLPVVAQQPHPDPNYAQHAAARLLVVA